MRLKFKGELCAMAMFFIVNTKFEKELTCLFKFHMSNLSEFH